MPGVDLRVVGPDGRDLPAGEEGELRLTGPQACKGYVDARLDADAFDDRGYFRTGDLGVVGPRGHVRITGRLKDIIIRNAENISAQEIENLLYTHPKVADVAVVGVPDRKTGERACAVVVLGRRRHPSHARRARRVLPDGRTRQPEDPRAARARGRAARATPSARSSSGSCAPPSADLPSSTVPARCG